MCRHSVNGSCFSSLQHRLQTQELRSSMRRQTLLNQHLVCGILIGMFTGYWPTTGHTAEGPTTADAPVIDELQLIKEEETVSIASRYEQPISQAPSNVYVITDEDIRHSGATDIPTLLRRVPGLEVMQTTGADFNVSARGNNQLAANKMLVMVDGRSIYIDAAGIVYWKLLPVTLPEIKRIEVLKGPASSAYGFNAFDGVINIITKSPEEMKGTTLQFGGGELGTISSAAIQAGTQGKFGYRLSIGRDQNQQWRNRDALAFRSQKLNVHTEYALPQDAKLTVSGGVVDSNRFDGIITEVTNSYDQPTQAYANVSYERRNFFLRSWWTGFSNTNRPTPDPLLANFIQSTDRNEQVVAKARANTYNLEAQHTLDLGSANQLTYGVNYRHNDLSLNIISQFSREDRLGFYFHDEWKATQTMTVVAGLRYDLDTFINSTVSPRVALLYRPAQDHTFRTAVSIAYRPPTLVEEKLDVRNPVTIGGFTTSFSVLGSARLSPEQIVSYELGYQGWYFKHRLRTRVDLFFNHLSDLIAFRPAGPGLADPVLPINGGTADIYGGEAGVEFLATSWLTGFANYSYQEFGQTFTGFSRRGMPRYKFNIGLRGEWENGLNAETGLYHVGAATYPLGSAFSTFAPSFPPGVTAPSERVGSYNLLNLRGGYHFWHDKAEVAVSAFNALNDKHKEYPLGDTIGSRVIVWLTIRF